MLHDRGCFAFVFSPGCHVVPLRLACPRGVFLSSLSPRWPARLPDCVINFSGNLATEAAHMMLLGRLPSAAEFSQPLPCPVTRHSSSVSSQRRPAVRARGGRPLADTARSWLAACGSRLPRWRERSPRRRAAHGVALPRLSHGCQGLETAAGKAELCEHTAPRRLLALGSLGRLERLSLRARAAGLRLPECLVRSSSRPGPQQLRAPSFLPAPPAQCCAPAAPLWVSLHRLPPN